MDQNLKEQMCDKIINGVNGDKPNSRLIGGFVGILVGLSLIKEYGSKTKSTNV